MAIAQPRHDQTHGGKDNDRRRSKRRWGLGSLLGGHAALATEAARSRRCAIEPLEARELLAIVSIQATIANASEQGPVHAQLTVTRTGDTSQYLPVSLSIAGTASNGSDFQTISNQVGIGVGQSSAVIPVTVIDDAAIENPETVIVTVLPAMMNQYTVSSTESSATVTIADNDSLPTVTITAPDPDAAEEGPDPGTFRFTRAGGNTSSALTVYFSTSGTASSGDFVSLGTSIQIAAGATQADLTLTPIDDMIQEGQEYARITLSTSSGYTVGGSNLATVYIADHVYAPSLRVEDGQTVLTDNVSVVSFGSVPVGGAATRTFTLRNVGNSTLTLDTGSVVLPPGFVVATQFGASVAAGGSTTFAVRFEPSSAGAYSGQASLASNDSSHNPFRFTLSAQATAPVIAVSEAGVALTSGQSYLEFGEVAFGSSATRTLTVSNAGDATLSLLPGSFSLPTGFSLDSGYATSLAPGASTQMVLRLNTAQVGTSSGQFLLASSDTAHSPFAISLHGNVVAPEIRVVDGQIELTDGAATIDFGATAWGVAVSRQLRVYNDGTAALALNTGSLSLPAGFTLTGAPSVSLAPGADTTLTIRMDANLAGSIGGAVSLGNDDPDENPFDFTIQGQVAAPLPNLAVTNQAGATVANQSTVDFGVTPLGTTALRTLTLANTGAAALTLDAESFQLPAGFSLGAALPAQIAVGASATLLLQFAPTAWGDYGGLASLISNDTAHSPFEFTLAAHASAPQIVVKLADEPLSSGAEIDFGNVPMGLTSDKTLTIENTGDADLTLDPNAIMLPDGYVVVAPFAAVVAAGQSTTFTLRLAGDHPGPFDGLVAISSNASALAFELALTGRMTNASVRVRDGAILLVDGSATLNLGSTLIGVDATRELTIENAGDAELVLDAESLELPPGFRVVTPFEVHLAPGATTTLGLAFSSDTPGQVSGVLRFTNNDAMDSVYSIQIVARATAPEIRVKVADANVADAQGSQPGSLVDFGVTPFATDVLREFEIYNDGDAPLLLDLESLELPAHFELAAPFAATVAPGGHTTLGVRLQAGESGYFYGRISFATSDADESPFDFDVEGLVLLPAPKVRLMDGAEALANSDGVDLGETPLGEPLVRSITIANDGPAPLTLQVADLVLPAGFSLAGPLAETVLPGESTVLLLRLDAAALGSYGGGVALATNDVDANPITLWVGGRVTAPQIHLRSQGASVLAGQTIDLGTLPYGTEFTRSFMVENLGSGELALGPGAITLPAGFSMYSPPAATVAPLGATWFAVKAVTTAGGPIGGQILIASNDPAASPLVFNLVAQVAQPLPDLHLSFGVDELYSGFSTVYFGAVEFGQPLTQTVSVQNRGDGPLSLDLASLSLPAGFSVAQMPAATLAGGGSSTLVIQLNASAAGVFSGTASLNSNNGAGAFLFELLGEVAAPKPKLRVMAGPVPMVAGGSLELGDVTQGTAASRTLTLFNDGQAPWQLDGESLLLPEGFSVAGALPTSLAPGESTTMELRLDGDQPGVYFGQLTFTSNDSTSPWFALNLGGIVARPVPKLEILQDGAGLTNGEGSVDFQSTLRDAPVTRTLVLRNAGGVDLELRSETVVVPDGFELEAPLPDHLGPGESTNIVLRLTAEVAGGYGGLFSLGSNDPEAGRFRFAVRGQVTNPAPVLQLTEGGAPVGNVGGVVDFDVTDPGTPVSKTFTISNAGTGQMTLEPGSLVLPEGYSASSLPTSLAPGESANVTVTMNAATEGAFAGVMSFSSSAGSTSVLFVGKSTTGGGGGSGGGGGGGGTYTSTNSYVNDPQVLANGQAAINTAATSGPASISVLSFPGAVFPAALAALSAATAVEQMPSLLQAALDAAKADFETAKQAPQATRDSDELTAWDAYLAAKQGIDSVTEFLVAPFKFNYTVFTAAVQGQFDTDTAAAAAALSDAKQLVNPQFDLDEAAAQQARIQSQQTANGNLASAKAGADISYDASLAIADADYDTALANAQSIYDAAIAAAETGFESSASLAQAAYDAAVAIHQSTFDATKSAAAAVRDATIGSNGSLYSLGAALMDPSYESAKIAAAAAFQSQLNSFGVAYDAAVSAADAAYNAAVLGATATLNAALDAAEATRGVLSDSVEQLAAGSRHAAESTYYAALDAHAAAYQSAVATALTAYANSFDNHLATLKADTATAQAAFDSGVAGDESTYDGQVVARTSLYNQEIATKTNVLNAAMRTAETDYQNGVNPLKTARDDAIEIAEQNYETAIKGYRTTLAADMQAAAFNLDLAYGQANAIYLAAQANHYGATTNHYLNTVGATEAIPSYIQDAWDDAKKAYKFKVAQANLVYQIELGVAKVKYAVRERAASLTAHEAIANAQRDFAIAEAPFAKTRADAQAIKAADFSVAAASLGAAYDNDLVALLGPFMQQVAGWQVALDYDLAQASETFALAAAGDKLTFDDSVAVAARTSALDAAADAEIFADALSTADEWLKNQLAAIDQAVQAMAATAQTTYINQVTTADVARQSAEAAAEVAFVAQAGGAVVTYVTQVATAQATSIINAASGDPQVAAVAYAWVSYHVNVAAAYATQMTADAGSRQMLSGSLGAAWQTAMGLFAAAEEGFSGDMAAAGVVWVGAEAAAAKTYGFTMSAAEEVRDIAYADADKTFADTIALKTQTRDNVIATAERTRDEAVGDATYNKAMAAWPLFVTYKQAVNSLNAANFGAVSLTYAEYRVAVNEADRVLAVELAPIAMTMTLNSAQAKSEYLVRTAQLGALGAATLANVNVNVVAATAPSAYRNENVGPDMLDMAAKFSAGMADSLTGGLSTRFNEWMWGEIARRNHQGVLFTAGQWTGVAIGMATGFGAGTCGSSWAYSATRMLAGLETVGGAINAGMNVYDGKRDLSDALAFLPLAGFALGKLLGKACFVVGTDVLLEESEPVLAADGGGELMVPVQSADGRWLWATVLVGLGVVGQTSLNARGERKRQDEEQDAIDLLFAADDEDADMDEEDLAVAEFARIWSSDVAEFARIPGVGAGPNLTAKTPSAPRLESAGISSASPVAEFARIWPADDVLDDISHGHIQRRSGSPLPSGPAFRLLDRPNVRRDFRAPNAFTSEFDAVPRDCNLRRSPTRRLASPSPIRRAFSPGNLWLAGCLLLAALFGIGVIGNSSYTLAPGERGQGAGAAYAVSTSHTNPTRERGTQDNVLAPSVHRCIASSSTLSPGGRGQGEGVVFSPSGRRRVPIETVRLGNRTAGKNPLREQVDAIEPDPATWRTVKLEMLKLNGLRLWIELLRPVEWIEAVGAEQDAIIGLDLAEMGAAGPALVTYIGPCTTIQPGTGSVVTGRFMHETDGSNVVALTLAGQAEATGVTDNHLYWSLDRNDFVPAGDLRPGERLSTDGAITEVVSIQPIPYTGRLYNLETTEHVYQVGSLGSLVHNHCLTTSVSPGQLGRDGETLASRITGAHKNTQKYTIGGRNRIPDQVLSSDVASRAPNHVVEVKNVRRQSLTTQLRDDIDLVGRGGRVDVFLPPGAKISGPLQRKFDDPLNPLNRLDLVPPH